MREIDLESSSLTNTFLNYGDSRSGKTRFSATFPRPLFLAEAAEKGWETISNMAPEEFFEPGVKPLVWAVDQMNDMATALGVGQTAGRVDPLIASGRVKTIVISSLTFYADLFLNNLINMQAKYDPRSVYGQLGNHLRDLHVRMHNKGVNVVWEALAKHPEPAQNDKEGNLVTPAEPGGPKLPGQAADKFPAGVQFLWYFKKSYPAGEKKPPAFEIYTQPHNKYPAGNRLGSRADLLPNPFSGDYSTFLKIMGHDPDAIRAALPPIANGTPKVIVAPAAPKKPPVITPVIRSVASKPAT